MNFRKKNTSNKELDIFFSNQTRKWQVCLLKILSQIFEFFDVNLNVNLWYLKKLRTKFDQSTKIDPLLIKAL